MCGFQADQYRSVTKIRDDVLCNGTLITLLLPVADPWPELGVQNHNRVWGQSPSMVQGYSPCLGGQEWSFPEAKHLLRYHNLTSQPIWHKTCFFCKTKFRQMFGSHGLLGSASYCCTRFVSVHNFKIPHAQFVKFVPKSNHNAVCTFTNPAGQFRNCRDGQIANNTQCRLRVNVIDLMALL